MRKDKQLGHEPALYRSHSSPQIIGTTSGGAQSWKPEFSGLLKGKRVIFLPDDDEPGRQCRDTVLASLGEVGVTATVVSFSGTGCKDLTEFWQALARGLLSTATEARCDGRHAADRTE